MFEISLPLEPFEPHSLSALSRRILLQGPERYLLGNDGWVTAIIHGEIYYFEPIASTTGACIVAKPRQAHAISLVECFEELLMQLLHWMNALMELVSRSSVQHASCGPDVSRTELGKIICLVS